MSQVEDNPELEEEKKELTVSLKISEFNEVLKQLGEIPAKYSGQLLVALKNHAEKQLNEV